MTPLGNNRWVTSVTYCIIKKTSCQEGRIILYKKDKKQIKKASLLRNPIYILAFTLALITKVLYFHCEAMKICA